MTKAERDPTPATLAACPIRSKGISESEARRATHGAAGKYPELCAPEVRANRKVIAARPAFHGAETEGVCSLCSHWAWIRRVDRHLLFEE